MRGIAIITLMIILAPARFSGAAGEGARPGMLLTVNPLWQRVEADDDAFVRYVAHLTGAPYHRVWAMWAYETGGGRSYLWQRHNNPAGIVYTRHAAQYGARPVWSLDEGGSWKASYPSRRAAAYDFARVWGLRRYRRCQCLDEEAFWWCLRENGWFSGRNVAARIAIANKLFHQN